VSHYGDCLCAECDAQTVVKRSAHSQKLLEHNGYNASMLAHCLTVPDCRLYNFVLLLRAVGNRRVLWLEWLEHFR